MDIGVYVIALGSMVLGPKAPNSIKSSAHVDQNHIDLGSSMLLSYGDRNQQIAVLHCTIEAETSKSATIFGSKGTLQIHKPFWCPNKLTLKQVGQPDQDFDFPYVKKINEKNTHFNSLFLNFSLATFNAWSYNIVYK